MAPIAGCAVALADPSSAATAGGAAAVGPFLTAENGIAFGTLTAMEIVLGIDNIVFIAILCGRLPEHQRNKARILGLTLAMLMRIALLFTIKWMMGLTKTTLFTMPIVGHAVTGKDLVLLVGGLFLIFKATTEIYHKVESIDEGTKRTAKSFWSAIAQIILIDIVFSLDSVITAVGMAKDIRVMVAAVVVSVMVMLAVSGKISAFIDRHPSVKMLALAFLLLIGVMLVADSMGQHIPKGYIYSAMAFSLVVEFLNVLRSNRSKMRQPAAL
jgi:predicted tellurium resistance membrane protein TerC